MSCKGPCATIVIGGTHSGSGKTTLATGIAAALVRRGLSVQSFKVGPDYLDPGYLKIATGRPCYNLDGWMCGKSYVRDLFNKAVQDADIAIVEGVMGLFDGASPVDLTGSTAEIALWLDAPILLVAPARGMARSFAAMIKGYVEFDKRLTFAGVIANRCGSSRQMTLLSDALASATLPPLLGGMPENSLPVLTSRHLGLVSADNDRLSPETVSSLAEAIEEHVDIDKMLSIVYDNASPLLHVRSTLASTPDSEVCIAIAYDEAFHFIYPDFLDILSEHGVRVAPFSPLHDTSLPDGCTALYFCGGYPEVYARELSNNVSMMDEVRAFAASGGIVYAECGGLMYLSRGIQTLDGDRYAMCSILPAWTRMLKKRSALGYREVTLGDTCIIGERGMVLRGHEFHYSELSEDPCSDGIWKNVFTSKRSDGSFESTAGYSYKRVLATYIHLHIPSYPEALHTFLDECRNELQKQQLGVT